VESDTRDVGGMAFKGENRVRIRGFDLIELDRVVSRSGEEAFVGRDAKTIDLRVWVGYRARAYPGKCFPEADCVVVAS
jgi:hypothetical protein